MSMRDEIRAEVLLVICKHADDDGLMTGKERAKLLKGPCKEDEIEPI